MHAAALVLLFALDHVLSTPDTSLLPPKLAVSPERRRELIAQLEKNHTGTPAPPQKMLESPPPPPPDTTADEWTWRARARQFADAVREAKENRALLTERAAALRARIRSLLSLGYRPGQFTYDAFQLRLTEDQLPAADLEVQRAERAYGQFLDDARRMNVMPGWLR